MPQNSACTNCKLHLNARSVNVWGRQVGSTGFEPIMVIGEAPGFHEDQQGSSFVGPSGKLLTEALEKVGIRDYYVTNVVKCFPDGTPSSTEISACKGYLDEEIRTVRPRCILALGNSAWHFFGRGPISEHAGRESRLSVYDCWVMPVLHPAAILRNPNQERAWRADLYRFARLVRNQLITEIPGDNYILTGMGWNKL